MKDEKKHILKKVQQYNHLLVTHATKIFLLIGVIILVLGVLNIVQISQGKALVLEQKMRVEEAKAPPEVDVYLIEDGSCTACPDFQSMINGLNEDSVHVLSSQVLASSDTKVTAFRTPNGLTRLPTIILKGDVDKFKSRIGSELVSEHPEMGLTLRTTTIGSDEEKVLFIEPGIPPYQEVDSHRMVGLVNATIINSRDCPNCTPMEPIITQLMDLGVVVTTINTINEEESEGAKLVKKYGVEHVPALLFSEDFGAYDPTLIESWMRTGRQTSDGMYILEQIIPPYVETATGRIRGEVDLTVLTTPLCDECYDALAYNLPILARFGIIPKTVQTVDVTSPEGKSLIAQYQITNAPIIILSKEANVYTSLLSAWKEVGSVERDGMYIFRKPERTGKTFLNLTSGEVVRAE